MQTASGDLRSDTDARRVFWFGIDLHLTPTGFALLTQLVARPATGYPRLTFPISCLHPSLFQTVCPFATEPVFLLNYVKSYSTKVVTIPSPKMV